LEKTGKENQIPGCRNKSVLQCATGGCQHWGTNIFLPLPVGSVSGLE